MPYLLQCGFIASGLPDHAKSKDVCSCTPVRTASADLVTLFPGGWGFGLAGSGGGDLFCWGVNAPTLLRLQGVI